MASIDTTLGLQGTRVVVTGAASGIGRATALALSAVGARLALMDWDEAGLAATAEATGGEERPLTHRVDVSDETSVDEAFEAVTAAWGGIDVLINVAGIMRDQMADIRNITLEDWQRVIGINLTGGFLTARAASRAMIPAGAGTIILVGSPAGVTGPSGSISYGSSKGGVNGLAMTLEKHLLPHGIRVQNFCPGSVDTPLLNKSLDTGVANGAPQSYADAARAIAVSPEGIGRALTLLASPWAADLKSAVFTR
jgi:3-oxoacyl-[acyl-carrier protein] reductase